MNSWTKWGNETILDIIEKELPQSTIYWLLISIVAAIIWVVYITYYNSRVIGLIATLILNKFVKYGHIHIGSFSVSVLSGKIMFRDVHFITEDYSVRFPLGYLIFRWWRPLTNTEALDDKSHAETRLTIYLDSFEWHVYNRSQNYLKLEKVFGLDLFMVPGAQKEEDSNSKSDENKPKTPQKENKWEWRDLIPLIKFEISSGKIVFGNYLMPTSLCINFGESNMLYTTKPASTTFDQFMHIVKCKCDHIRVMLVPSPKYQGTVDDEPPRYMGDGFVVLQTNNCDIYYYYDEPGVVPYEPEQVQLANGDVIARRTWPCLGMDIKCGKGTDMSYGPWADRQREYLWKFFYPPDFQPLVPDEFPGPGQHRTWKSFDFKMSMQQDATFDVLFTKNRETQAMHMNMKHGTYLEFTIPWITDETGFVTKVNGQLMHLEATTSLAFRQFIECETLQFDVEATYPLNWNEHQDWKCNITGCKVSGSLLFHHKAFLVDLIDDWSSKSRSDLFHFVPYTWTVNILLKEFEVLLKATEWNWIDCFGNQQNPENTQIAFCGETFDVSFALPYVDYLPEIVPIKFFIRAETADCRFYLPESNTSRLVMLAISENMKIVDRNGVTMDKPFMGLFGDRWRRLTQKSAGWIDVWTTPIVALNINYTYHPMPATGGNAYKMQVISPISTPDAEERLLIPLRASTSTATQQAEQLQRLQQEFDAADMEHDIIDVDLEVGPSIICVYGCLVTSFYNVKENYLGEDQKFTDFDDSGEGSQDFEHVLHNLKQRIFDPRYYRPLGVNVNAALHDIQAHLVKNSNKEDEPCPCVHIEKIVFELDKKYLETKLQVLVSPAFIVIKDNFKLRPEPHKHVNEGHLALSGLQIRGHAMFSHKGLPLEADTLEYGWLLEVTVGDLTGRLTSSHIQNVVDILQTQVFLVEDSENSIERAVQYTNCQHGVPQPECTHNTYTDIVCPSGEDIKYKMTRVSIDCVDLYLAEAGTALNVQIYPVRLSTCNLHGKNDKAGVSALIPNINLRQFVLSVPISQPYSNETDFWLEAGGVCLGPITVDAAMALPDPLYHTMQDKFLKLHDAQTKRLWFLWPPGKHDGDPSLTGKCGCVGNSCFFGRNRNGASFFKPSEEDFSNGICTAVHHICVDEDNYGYGQSLLQKNQLVFTRIPGPLFLSTPTRNFLQSQKLKETVIDLCPNGPESGNMNSANQTGECDVYEDSSFQPESEATLIKRPEVLHLKASFPENLNTDKELLIQPSPDATPVKCVQSPTESLISGTSTVPTEYLPGSTIPDAYDTDRYISTPSDAGLASATSTSVPSLSDMVELKHPGKTTGHERKSSYDPPNKTSMKSPIVAFCAQNGLQQEQATASKTSLKSSQHSILSHTSSLTSPVLRRFSQMEGSLVSVDSTATFTSAKEDISDTVSNWSYTELSNRIASDPTINETPADSSIHSDEPLWFAMDRDSTMNTVISRSLIVHMEEDENVSSSSSGSIASFVSAVSSQAGSRQDVMTKELEDGGRSTHDSIDKAKASTEDSALKFRPSLQRQSVSLGSFPISKDNEGVPCTKSLLKQQSSGDDSLLDNMDLQNGQPPAGNCIDLHGQMNQPITKSPLLMSCYTTHMTKLRCSHWSAPGPHPHGYDPNEPADLSRAAVNVNSYLTRQTSLSSDPSRSLLSWIPQFVYTREGFTPSLMVNRREPLSPPHLSSPVYTAGAEHHRQRFFSDSTENLKKQDKPFGNSSSIDSSLVLEDEVSKTTAVINFKGSVDVMVSPLMLEALQRYVESVTPVLESLHPSTIIDSLHFQCSSQVKGQNKFKQKSAAEIDTSMEKSKADITTKDKRSSMTSNGENESKTSRLQVMFSLSRINLCILQASLVEEMIPFSGLDRVQELTCVSVLAVCLDSISCQLLLSNQSRKAAVEFGSSPDGVVTATGGVRRATPPDTLRKQDTQNDDEPSETQLEDLVGQLSIQRVHFQLRRLKKNSNFSKNVFLTTIPEHRSKVLFTFQPQVHPAVDRQNMLYMGDTRHRKYQGGQEEEEESQDLEDIAGFVMVECGLEDITLKAAKRKGYTDSSTEEQHYANKIEQVLKQTYVDETKTESCSRSARPSSSMSTNQRREQTEDGVRSQRDNVSTRSRAGTESSGHSADDEASWSSRISLDSKGSEEKLASGKQDLRSAALKGDASSCVLEFKTVWFNFAAPPYSSAKNRKLEFTRYDWNLLSTATPAINAWMNPTHRAVISAQSLIRKLNNRISRVMACIMTEALDKQGIHVPAKNRYSHRLTPLSRTLQEDPSCQLLTVLRRFMQTVEPDRLEESVRSDTVPQLLTLQKGLLALTRQWKTRLYMPAENAFKKKKVTPFTVTFASVPKDDSLPELREDGHSLENFDADEKTSLLKADGSGSVQHTPSLQSLPVLLGFQKQTSRPPSLVQSPAEEANEDVKRTRKINTSMKSLSQPLEPAAKPTLRHNESHTSFHSASQSLSDVDGVHPPSLPGTPMRHSLTRHLSQLDKREEEDMYVWMQRQQEYTNMCNHPNLHQYPSMGQESFINTGISEFSQEDSLDVKKLTTLPQSGFPVADAQILFKPLLRAIGLRLGEIKTSAIMKKLGCHLSITGLMSSLRVDIVDSETSGRKRNKGKGKGKRPLPRFHIDTGLDMPAFFCDTFSAMVSMKDIVNFEKLPEEFAEGEGSMSKKKSSKVNLAFEGFEAKPTTTKVNFALNVHSVNQHINMSLLRLVHQFYTMIENIRETRTELKGLTSTDAFKGHKKQDSKGSSTDTGADVDVVGQPEFPCLSGVPLVELEPPTPSPISVDMVDCAPSTSYSEPRILEAHPQPTRRLHTPLPQSRPDRLPLSDVKPSKRLLIKKNRYELLSSPSSDPEEIEMTVQGAKPLVPGAKPDPPPKYSHSVSIEIGADTSSPALAEKTIVDEIKDNTPKCWRTLYALLDLYSTMPEPKTINKPAPSRLSVIDEEPDRVSQTASLKKKDSVQYSNRNNIELMERQPTEGETSMEPPLNASTAHPVASKPYTGATFTQSIVIGERTPLVVFGMMKLKNVRMSAILSGLKLEADLKNVNASATHRERVKGVTKRKTGETSVTVQVGHTMVVLLEGVAPNMQTVVTLNMAKSEGLYSCLIKRMKDRNSTLVTLGKVDIDIPQHPGVLHGMVSRSSKRLSTTLQEFMRPPSKSRSFDTVDSSTPSAQPSKSADLNSEVTPGHSATEAVQPVIKVAEEEEPPKPLVIHMKAVLKGLAVGASLLPSLRAQYQMGKLTASGVTGKKAHFIVDLPSHSLSFSSKMQTKELAEYLGKVSTPINLPEAASIDLPPIHMHAEYRQQNATGSSPTTGGSTRPAQENGDIQAEGLTEGLMERDGNFLEAVAEVGVFEHCLTTDLLNHLVFVQKIFMKEINEVVQKISGVDQPVSIWGDEGINQAPVRPLLYSLHFRLKGIQITATTPTSSAVRLETGLIDLDLSNRVQTARKDQVPSSPKHDRLKVFVNLRLELNLSLGTLMKNLMFEEAQAEFQELATFQTRISMRNALQDEMIPGAAKDQEALMISLKRPIVSVMPSAFDKAVLVWLNYKNAYEYWTEQRLSQIKEWQQINTTGANTQPTTVFETVDERPIPPETLAPPPPTRPQAAERLPSSTTAQQALGTLFLQLTMDDLGVCLPLCPANQSLVTTSKLVDETGAPALVLTLESTQITACSCGSLVSKGKFLGFCLRFADDFELTWDDWKPANKSMIMNAMVVPEGTYEVCSRTTSAVISEPTSNAKWILNVKWQMEGIDINLDTNIGKRLSALGDTLTSLGGGEEPEKETTEDTTTKEKHHSNGAMPTVKVTESTATMAPQRRISTIPEGLPAFVYDTALDNRVRARLIEQEMNQQASIVSDLKQLGASQSTIEAEEKRLQEYESALFLEFRQDLMKKIKKQSNRATALKDKLGLGYKPSHVRSKSTGHTGSQLSRKKGSQLASCSEESSKGISPYVPDSSSSSESEDGHSRNLSVDVSSLWKEGGHHVKWDVSPSAQSTVSDTILSTTIDDPTHFTYSPGSSQTQTPESSPQAEPELLSETLLNSSSSLEEEERTPVRGSKSWHPHTRTVLEGSHKVPSPTGTARLSTTLLEPSVDFELDIKVNISSGKCVLHPKEPKLEESDGKSKKDMKASPRSERKKAASRKANLDMSGRSFVIQPPTVDSRTLFFLPGVDIKVHYGSKTAPASDSNTPESTLQTGVAPPPADLDSASFSLNMPPMKEGGCLKKANLYAWISIQQLSEEMLITPALLDFLEQALEPISMVQLMQSRQNSKISTSSSLAAEHNELDESVNSLGTSYYAYGSFPVDVVVYIRVQPSRIRFSCLPVSRVECLLRMPSVDVVFSSKKSDVEPSQITADGTPPVKPKRESTSRLGSMSSQSHLFNRSGSRSRHLSGVQQDPSSGGLSVTACMADFSFYIFHPYGGGTTHKRTDLTLLESTFRKNTPGVSSTSASPVIEMGRKDSLSLNVEFVKVNISRTRKGLLQRDGSGANLFSRTDSQSQKAANIVRFSALCDIGSASFKYDMRRLSEILALPKAWYRRTLARRLFLGEEMAVVDESDSDDDTLSSVLISPPLTPDVTSVRSSTNVDSFHYSPKVKDDTATHKRSSSTDSKQESVQLREKKFVDESKVKTAAPQSPDKLKLPGSILSRPSPLHPFARHVLSDTGTLGQDFDSLARAQVQSPCPGAGRTTSDWETLVLFAVNLSQLDVVVNMSNVMGNTVWATRDLKSQGQLSIDSSGYRNMKITSGLSGSKVDARGGIVGGCVEIQDLNTIMSIREEPGHEPDHSVTFKLCALESRLDYMGSSVLMARLSDLHVKLGDEWRVADGGEDRTPQPLATSRPALIFVNGDLTWDKFHMMISRSTTPDLVKMVSKLDEFFTQQLNSSKRVLSAFGPISMAKAKAKNMEQEASWISEIKHHRHWQRVLEHIAGCKFSNLTFTLPQVGTILGGTMSLHGNNLTLACFHGINFRSKSWALFTMEEPFISFSTESQSILDSDDRKCTHIIQHMTYHLGSNTITRKDKRHMAYICKLSRGHYMPPPFTNVADWFHYAFATSEIKDLDSFPQMVRLGSPTGSDTEKPERKSFIRKGTEYNHDTEVIFVLPPLQLVMKTEHLQEENEPDETEGPKPIVDCSFVTEFEDHIFVAMDAEVLLFLHDLVTSYVREKDKGSEKQIRSPDLEKKELSSPITVLKLDYRDFRCNTWHLEPTIRLISWAGKRIEPVGVDYILQKLGFQHARLTVPKWMQRGCMDPLDKVLSLLLNRLIVFLKEENHDKLEEL